MLGERRSNSLFAPAAPAEPERKPEQAEVHDISFEERTGRSLFAETATAPRASELFFAPQEKGITFADALSQVQGYLSETYATLITEDNSGAKEQMKRRMARYLQENRIAVDGMTASELVELDTLLNIDGKGQAHTESVVAKSTRPSVLDNLKRPVQPRSTDKKPKQHEEVR